MTRRNGAIAAFLLAAALGVAPAGATQFRRVTADTTRETDPAPSPDGKWLAFTSDRTGSYQIWVMPLAGGPARQLTFDPESLVVKDPDRPDTTRTVIPRAATPTWAPDCKSLLFISTRTGRYNIYSLPLEGGTPRALASPIGNNRFAVYSPDGRKIAFYSNRLDPGQLFGFNVYVMDSAGETLERMARPVTRGAGSPGHPTWSPDGQWIAYVSKSIDSTKTVSVGPGMRAKQNEFFARYRLWKSPAGGGKGSEVGPVEAAGEDVEDTWPSWSPVDPRWLAVGRRVGSKQNVWLIDMRTGRGFPLTTSGTAGKPTWTSDGKAIYYSQYAANGKEDIWVATDFTLRPPPASGSATPSKRSPGSRKKTTPGGTKGSAAN